MDGVLTNTNALMRLVSFSSYYSNNTSFVLAIMTLNIVMDGPKTMDIWGGPKTSPETKFGVAMPSPSGVTPETTFCFSHNDLYI